jgi:hypothetical protein
MDILDGKATLQKKWVPQFSDSTLASSPVNRNFKGKQIKARTNFENRMLTDMLNNQDNLKRSRGFIRSYKSVDIRNKSHHLRKSRPIKNRNNPFAELESEGNTPTTEKWNSYFSNTGGRKIRFSDFKSSQNI